MTDPVRKTVAAESPCDLSKGMGTPVATMAASSGAHFSVRGQM